ncbi:PAS domain S-box protein [Nocardioides glacieisoli]|uniref:PAS domain S-box protein n=1 Tax=Nocardioides glacieisoli TaxID=1168730 RepID=A0A4Q2RLR4_9ACTN|nr:PAS domain S-box protein [Nocardioides glacieisoli]
MMGVSHDGPHGDLLRRLVDQLPGMVAYWDPDLRLVLANAAYCTFVGRPAEGLHGQHFSAVLGEEVYRANLPHLQGALSGEPQVFERTLSDGLGVTRHAEVSYGPDVVDGQVEGIFALITDVTPRVEAQRDLDEAQELAGLASWTFRPAEET